MRVVLGVVVALLVAAGWMVSPAMAQGCAAKVSVPWSGAKGYKIVASSKGARCASATIALTIIGPDGEGTEVYAAKADENAVFVEVSNLKSMQTALSEWVSMPAKERKTTAELSEWPEGADQPSSGEFPFYPDEHVDRLFYEDVRSTTLPMLCFVQGMESARCIYIDAHGGVNNLGAQSFPG
jgi:hypothetical protein